MSTWCHLDTVQTVSVLHLDLRKKRKREGNQEMYGGTSPGGRRNSQSGRSDAECGLVAAARRLPPRRAFRTSFVACPSSGLSRMTFLTGVEKVDMDIGDFRRYADTEQC